jgi:hypothetical protein
MVLKITGRDRVLIRPSRFLILNFKFILVVYSSIAT